jgi:group I intron endonuclease
MEIYLIENLVNNKKYVGMTTRSKECRFGEHIDTALSDWNSNKDKKQPIHHAIKKYGSKNFTIRTLEVCKNFDELIQAEQKWIKKMKSFIGCGLGYNATTGGEGTSGFICSDKTKEKLSQLRLGKKHTEETKQKMSVSRKGKKPTAEHRKNLSEAQTGVKNHRYGKQFTKNQQEHRSKLVSGENNPFYGKNHSEETKKIISKKNIGRHSGSKNPAARKCIINNRIYDTCRELMRNENIKLGKFYNLVKNGTIQYENS